VRVDLDFGHLWAPTKLVTLSPLVATYSALLAALAPGIDSMDAPTCKCWGFDDSSSSSASTSAAAATAATAARVRAIFRATVESLLAGSGECCSVLGAGKHRVALFSEKDFEAVKTTATASALEVSQAVRLPLRAYTDYASILAVDFMLACIHEYWQ
jgi:hypothetical protein